MAGDDQLPAAILAPEINVTATLPKNDWAK
jgi:hypothetical protein